MIRRGAQDDPAEARGSTRLATVERLTGMDAVEEMRDRASFVEGSRGRRRSVIATWRASSIHPDARVGQEVYALRLHGLI